MTQKELLKPRWKVIANFPGNTKDLGKIYESYSDTDLRCNIVVFERMFADYPDNYPEIFRKLEWWEGIRSEDIPEYLKLISTNEIVKVLKKVGGFTGTVFVGRMFREKEVWTHLSFYLPSTKEEYDKQ